MVKFKLLFIYSDAEDENLISLILKPNGWKKTLLTELPETDKELKFSQIKNLNKFVLKLNENPFDHIFNLNNQLLINHSINNDKNPFKLIILELEFWSIFNDTLYTNLTLELNICENEFNWSIENIKKQTILKEFDNEFIQNSNQSCLSDFRFSIINLNENEFKIDELNIVHLGVFYSTVNIDLNDLNETNTIWNQIERQYRLIKNSTDKNLHQPIKYECKLDDCNSFLINSKKIVDHLFYPKTSSIWNSFYSTRQTDEIFSLQFNKDIKLASNYTIEFYYFITKNVKLNIFTSINNNSIITLYPTYSYQLEDELFKWLPVIINLKDLLPFQLNSIKSGFKIYIQSIIELNRSPNLNELNRLSSSIKSTDFEMAAIGNIKLNSGDHLKLRLTDYLTSWNSNGNRALNEWTCLVDSTEFYSGYFDKSKDQSNNISIAFFAPKYKSKSTYVLLSKWFKANDQIFEIKINNELKSQLKIETLDMNLTIINSYNYILNQFNLDNYIYYDILNKQKQFAYYKSYVKFKDDKLNLRSQSSEKILRLRLSFDLENLDDENQPKKILISHVNLADPCNNPNLCIFSNDCIPYSSTEFSCKCKDGYHGDRCEFIDQCFKNSTGYKKCFDSENALNCISIRDKFRCECTNDKYWLNDNNFSECKYLPFCYTKDNLINNQCIYNHQLSYDLNIDNKFNCNRLFDINSFINSCNGFNNCNCLGEGEKCIENLLPNIIGDKDSACVCDLHKAYLNISDKCVLINNIKLPFLKQYLNCSHSYMFASPYSFDSTNNSVDQNFNLECNCLNGYKSINNSCSLEKKCNKKCNDNQICTFDENGNEICECEIGLSGKDCEINFCDQKENYKLIKSLCGDSGCNTTIDNLNKIKFICNCDKRFYYLDKLTGLCIFRDVCMTEGHICNAQNAICIPSIDFTTNSLSYECICPQGWKKDKLTNRCLEICDFYDFNQLINKRCFPNLELKEPKFLCKPGFILDENDCILSEKENKFEIEFNARINLDDDHYYKFNMNKNRESNLFNLNCKEYLDPINCFKMINRSFIKLERLSNQLQINQSFIYSLSNLIRISFQSILGDDLFNSQILNYELIGDHINSSIDNSTFKQSTDRILNKKYFQLLKFRIYLETDGYFKELNENFFIQSCNATLCPLYPYLHIVKDTFKIRSLSLNQTDYLVECFSGSSPVFEENSNSLFRCECDLGVCINIDECKNNEHKCDLNTTECVNHNGGYKCDCLYGLERKNRFSCYKNFELDHCSKDTTVFRHSLPSYECECKNENLIKKDDFNCWDPCLNAHCKINTKCLPYGLNNRSYICVYDDNEIEPNTDQSNKSINEIIILLILWTVLNILITLILIYKYRYSKRYKIDN